jgi:hypothetical protein
LYRRVDCYEFTNVLEVCTASVIMAESIFALMMEAVQTSETFVNLYQFTWRYNPEDGHLYTRRRKKLKSHVINGMTD